MAVLLHCKGSRAGPAVPCGWWACGRPTCNGGGRPMLQRPQQLRALRERHLMRRRCRRRRQHRAMAVICSGCGFGSLRYDTHAHPLGLQYTGRAIRDIFPNASFPTAICESDELLGPGGSAAASRENLQRHRRRDAIAAGEVYGALVSLLLCPSRRRWGDARLFPQSQPAPPRPSTQQAGPPLEAVGQRGGWRSFQDPRQVLTPALV